MKNIFSYFQKKAKNRTALSGQLLRKEQVEKRAVEGARRAVKEYGRVFDRLAEYDQK